MTNDKPKTALEIALERLRQRDADSGVVDKPPTEEQKMAIAEVRLVHSAKVAELEILHRAKLAGIFDPADRAKAEDDYRRELLRLNDDREKKVGKIRDGTA